MAHCLQAEAEKKVCAAQGWRADGASHACVLQLLNFITIIAQPVLCQSLFTHHVILKGTPGGAARRQALQTGDPVDGAQY
jgi:hypothetical protein